MSVPIEAIGGGAAVLGGSLALAYRIYKKGGSASADFDNDGEDEITVESGSDCEHDDSEEDEKDYIAPNPVDPTPERIQEIGNDLEDIKGIGPKRKQQLIDDGFLTAADLYYASDENLEDVTGFGERAVNFIRDDIGGIDY